MLFIERVNPDNGDLRFLIRRLDQELLLRYPPEEIFGLDLDDPAIDQVVFVIARHGSRPVGCGAIRPIDSHTAELKRFYVEPDCRKQGIAAGMLARLEELARELKFTSMKLETGTEQPESIQFYRKHGFHEIPPFGDYTECPTSVCFEKSLQEAHSSKLR